jgi:hypothetical protein
MSNNLFAIGNQLSMKLLGVENSILLALCTICRTGMCHRFKNGSVRKKFVTKSMRAL